GIAWFFHVLLPCSLKKLNEGTARPSRTRAVIPGRAHEPARREGTGRVIRSSPLRADNDSTAQQPKGVHMRRLATPVAVIALLAAGGFAAVSIASGGGLGHGTPTGLTTPAGGKVAICHRTGSKKKPFHTITVAVPAVRAHLKHGDVLGPCTVATVAAMKKHGRGAAKHTTTTTT